MICDVSYNCMSNFLLSMASDKTTVNHCIAIAVLFHLFYFLEEVCVVGFNWLMSTFFQEHPSE